MVLILRIESIFLRLCEYYQVDTNKELCKKVDWNYSTFSNWLSRDSIPYKALDDISQNENLSMDWILYGKKSAQSVDLNTLQAAIEAVEAGLNETDRVMRIEKKAELISTVYKLFINNTNVKQAQDNVLNVLKLIS